ncbi:uncharacterized protein LOC132394462 isoform X2 [Hypanus sabinus]|uniref:uncharacterized protein LOC132394462 isoform X2 n=1 Tax=Hypanus sabinus TaxID=79690 RepID=UPI0028C3D168|nr:uncharacterized protein LOC132394462 isoform X2 [Hypanus sabinus]
MSQVVGFRVGAEFSSYSELHREYRRYQREYAVQLWTRHSRTIEAQRRRAPKRPMNDALKFAEIDYACIHGGKLFKTKGSGKRANQRTNKMKCPCVIKVRLSPDGDKFVVKEMNESHNHTVQQVKAAHRYQPGGTATASDYRAENEKLSHQRRFVKVLHGNPASVVSLQSNGAGAKEQLREVASKVLIRQDGHSLPCKDKWGSFKVQKTDLEKMVPTLAAVKAGQAASVGRSTVDDLGRDLSSGLTEGKDDGTVVVVVSKANVLQAIYYQDSSMKQTYEKFPEVLLIDTTYSWEGLQLPTYLLLAIDGNGESELVCLWFLQNEERETVRQLLRIFKQKNPASERTGVVVTSGEVCSGELVSDVLPDSKPLTCLVHTLRAFQGDVTAEKLEVTSGEQSQLLQILHSMCYATSAEEYDLLHHQLQDITTQRTADYFNQTWHASRHQWVEGFKHQNESYLTSTINRVQALSQRLRAAISDFSNAPSFTHDLLKAVDLLRAEDNLRAVRMFQKVPPASLEAGSATFAYCELLTDFAFTRVQRELEEAEGVSFLSVEAESASPICRRRALITDCNNCQCTFRTAMHLPCRHILAFRRLRGAELFESSLCSGRWTRKHYLRHRPVSLNSGPSPVSSPESPAGPEVQQERYRQAFKVARKLSSLAAQCPAEEFGRCLAVMTAVTNIWARGGQSLEQESETH